MMFKPIHWKTIPRDFAVIQIGFALFGLAIACLIQANLGASPWVMLTVALANITGLTPGIITILTGIVVLSSSLIMREQIGWGTLANILFIGLWVDMFLWFIPSVTNNWLLQITLLLASIVTMGLGSAIYISVNAGAGPRDSLMLSVSRLLRVSLRTARSGIELCVFVLAFFLGGPFGVGTIVFALLIGASVQQAFKLFNVHRVDE